MTEDICVRHVYGSELITGGCPGCHHVLLLHPSASNALKECVVCRLLAMTIRLERILARTE